jgi:hypothetical protein
LKSSSLAAARRMCTSWKRTGRWSDHWLRLVTNSGNGIVGREGWPGWGGWALDLYAALSSAVAAADGLGFGSEARVGGSVADAWPLSARRSVQALGGLTPHARPRASAAVSAQGALGGSACTRWGMVEALMALCVSMLRMRRRARSALRQGGDICLGNCLGVSCIAYSLRVGHLRRRCVPCMHATPSSSTSRVPLFKAEDIAAAAPLSLTLRDAFGNGVYPGALAAAAWSGPQVCVCVCMPPLRLS